MIIRTPRPYINNSCTNVRRVIRETLKPNPCRHCCAVLRKADDPGRMAVRSLPCKRRNCTVCHPYWVGSWLLPDLERFAECASTLHAWRGPAGQLRAVTVRCGRAGVHYRAIRLADGTALVIASGEFPGGTRRTLDVCAEWEAIALENASPVRNPVSGCQAWRKPRKEPSGKWVALAVGVGVKLRTVVAELEKAGAAVTARHDSKLASTVLVHLRGMSAEQAEKAALCAVLSLRPEYPERPPVPADTPRQPASQTPAANLNARAVLFKRQLGTRGFQEGGMSATRLYEWELDTTAKHVDLYYIPGFGDGYDLERVALDHLARFWPYNAWVCFCGRTNDMHEYLAEGEALAAAAKAGLIAPESIAAGYRVCRTWVTFYAGGMFSVGRYFRTVTGPKGDLVTAACRLYPASPMAQAWLVARDEILERGLAREAA